MMHTLQPINGPLLKLLEGDLSRRRRVIQVQTVRVVLLLVDWYGELPFFVVDSCPAFGVDTVGVLSNHGVESES